MSKKRKGSIAPRKHQPEQLQTPPRRSGGKRLLGMAGVAIVLAAVVLVVVKSKSSTPVQSSTQSPTPSSPQAPTPPLTPVSSSSSNTITAGQKWYSDIPGIDFTKVTAEQRDAVLKRLNNEGCGCGCKMTLAQCRHEDRNCPVSPGLVVQIVKEMTGISFPVVRGGQPGATISTGPQTGQPAPDFALQDLQGRTWKLSALRGKVVLLNFWATWCGPCRVEIPDFLKVYRERRKQGFEIIGVSIDHMGVDVVKKFVENNDIDYPVAMSTKELTQVYGHPTSIPTTFIIDRQGKLHSRHVGAMSAAALDAALKPVF